jgi:hypothetical protein
LLFRGCSLLPFNPFVDILSLEPPRTGDLEARKMPALGQAVDGLSSTFNPASWRTVIAGDLFVDAPNYRNCRVTQSNDDPKRLLCFRDRFGFCAVAQRSIAVAIIASAVFGGGPNAERNRAAPPQVSGRCERRELFEDLTEGA